MAFMSLGIMISYNWNIRKFLKFRFKNGRLYYALYLVVFESCPLYLRTIYWVVHYTNLWVNQEGLRLGEITFQL